MSFVYLMLILPSLFKSSYSHEICLTIKNPVSKKNQKKSKKYYCKKKVVIYTLCSVFTIADKCLKLIKTQWEKESSVFYNLL